MASKTNKASYLDWPAFEVKAGNNPQAAFESLSYALFCVEFNYVGGIPRHFNQPYIETEPIAVGGEKVGFQAKYYRRFTSAEKKELKDGITGALGKYEGIKKYVLYLRCDPSEPAKKDLNGFAEEKGIEVEWRTASYFESKLMHSPEHAYIRDWFFNLDERLPEVKDNLKTVARRNPKHFMALLGAFDENSYFDTLLVQEFAGIDFNDFVVLLESTMVQAEGFTWSLENQQDIIAECLQCLTAKNAETLYRLYSYVLSGVFGKYEARYSSVMKKAVANTLVLVHGSGIDLQLSRYSGDYAGTVVARSFRKGHWKCDVEIVRQNYEILPILAEAAPKIIFDIINETWQELSKCEDETKAWLELFPILRNAQLNEYEWESKQIKEAVCEALCKIAWYPQMFARAAVLLAKIGYSELPLMFLPYRQTTDSATAVQGALRKIASEFSNEKAFSLIKDSLIPKWGPVLPPHTPKCFELLDSNLSTEEQQERRNMYFELAVELAKIDHKVMLELFPQWTVFGQDCYDQLLPAIRELESNLKDKDARFKLWNRLCNRPHYLLHGNHGDELPNEIVDKIKEVGELFRPKDEIECLKQWFFDTRDYCLYDSEKHTKSRQLVEQKAAAVKRVYDLRGMQGVIDYLEETEDKSNHFDEYDNLYGVNALFKDINLTAADEKVVLQAFLKIPQSGYGRYFGTASYVKGLTTNNAFNPAVLTWFDSLGIAELSTAEKAKLFSACLCTQETVDYYEAHLGDDVELFWKSMYPRELRPDCFAYGIKRFRQFGLLSRAVEAMFTHIYEKQKVDPDIIFELMLDWYATGGAAVADVASPLGDMDSYHCNKILEALRKSNYDQAKMLDLEEAIVKRYEEEDNLRGIFSSDYKALSPQVLFEYITTDPAWFVKYAKKRQYSFSPSILEYFSGTIPSPAEWYYGVQSCVQDDLPEEAKGNVLYTLGEYLVRHTDYTTDCVAKIVESSDGLLLRGIKNAFFNYQNHAFTENIARPELADKFEKQAVELEEKGYIDFSALLTLVAESFRSIW